MVTIARGKAKYVHEIKCAARGKKGLNGKAVKCPPGRGETGHKFLGVHKCYGCPSALWNRGALVGQPYGPGRRLNW